MKYIYLIVFAIAFCPALVQSQGVVTLEETSQTHKVLKVDKPNPVFPISDINSTIKINLNKKIIDWKIEESYGIDTIPYSKLESLAKISREQAELLDLLNISPYATRSERVHKMALFADKMLSFKATVKKELPELTPKIKVIFNARGANKYTRMLNLVAEEINKTNEALKRGIKSSNIHFQLRGWILNPNKPKVAVSIAGFDNYKESPYSHANWASNISPQGQDKLKANVNAIKQLNTKADDAVKSLKGLISTTTENLDTKVMALKDSLNKIVSIPGIKNKSKSSIIQLSGKLNTIAADIVTVKNSIANIKNGGDIKQVEHTIKGLEKQLHSTKRIIESDLKTITDLPTQVKTDMDNIANHVKSTVEDLLADDMSDLNKNFGSISMAVSTEQQKAIKNFVQTGESFWKSAKSIPSETYIDLTRSAYRVPGSKLKIEALITDSIGEKSSYMNIFSKQIALYPVHVYVRLTPSIIFVNSFSQDTVPQFVLSPSFNFLMKWGTRKNSFTNRFLQPGVGINVATLDLDNNNVPEIGLGLTFSCMRDILQVGLGRNMTTDENYWFFGVQLPLGINLGDVKNTVGETTNSTLGLLN